MTLDGPASAAMRYQRSLPGLDVPPAWFGPERVNRPNGRSLGQKLFLAICPRSDESPRIAEAAANLRRRLGLLGLARRPATCTSA
jgi:hypothetical protein